MKMLGTVSGITTLIVSMAISASGDVYSPVANLTEKWGSNTAGWVQSGAATLVYSDASVGMNFGARDPNNLASTFTQNGSLVALTNASGGRFVGNYVLSGITGISFDLKRTGPSSVALLRILGANNATWSYRFTIPATSTTQWTHVDIPFGESCGWFGSVGTFQETAQSVVKVWILATRDGFVMEDLTIDNFKVVGPWGGPTIGGVPQSWLQENELSISEDPTATDSDGDGQSDFAEFLAATNPKDATSMFAVSIVLDAQGHAMLKWNRGNAQRFGVWSSTKLDSPEGFSKTHAGLTATEMIVDDEGSSRFYRVEIEQ